MFNYLNPSPVGVLSNSSAINLALTRYDLDKEQSDEEATQMNQRARRFQRSWFRMNRLPSLFLPVYL